jgi:hypothetical protein
MKAITCSQCGALIKGISMKKEFASCDYCGAEMQIKLFEKKVIDIPNKIAKDVKTQTHWEIYLKNREENRRKYNQHHVTISENDDSVATLFLPGLFIVLVLGLSAFLYYSFNKNENLKYADFKVTSEISYPSNLRKEKLHFPKIFRENISESDVENLRDLAPEKRIIKVRIMINKQGEILKAVAETNNSLLRESAEKAALKTSFYPIGYSTNEFITYRFLYR